MLVVMAGAVMLTRGAHGHEAIKVTLGFDDSSPCSVHTSHLSLSPREIVSLVGNLIGMPLVMWICLATSREAAA